MIRATAVTTALFGIALGLALAEVMLAAGGWQPAFRFPSFRITDDRFSSRAGDSGEGNGVHYRFDRDGFRVDEEGRAGEQSGPAVLFIGDSFTQGFGVEERQTFPSVVCDRLASAGVVARCLNAGTTGFGTAHELRLMRRLLAGRDLGIVAVVFQVLPNNDLRDNWEDGGFGIDDGRLATYEPPRIPIEVRLRDGLLDNGVARNSRLIALAANAWFNGTGMDPHYDADSLELERLLLQEAVAIATRQSLQIVLAVVATGWEVESRNDRPYDDRHRLDFVTGAIGGLGVPWIDSREIAAAADNYIPNDGHFSVTGNARIGEAIAAKLLPLLPR